MAKYHIRKDGTPGICHAQEGNCPLGGSENHVEAETLEQAQQYFDDKNESFKRQLDYLDEELDGNIEDYSDEEQAVLLGMRYNSLNETNTIKYDQLPKRLQDKVRKKSGYPDTVLKEMDIIVNHADTKTTKNWADEYGMTSEEFATLGDDEAYNVVPLKGDRGNLSIEKISFADQQDIIDRVLKEKQEEQTKVSEPETSDDKATAEHLDYLKIELKKDLSKYNNEEQAVFKNMRLNTRNEVNMINFEDLPEDLQNKVRKKTGYTPEMIARKSIIVEHADSASTKNWADEMGVSVEDYMMDGDDETYYAIPLKGKRGNLVIEKIPFSDM